MQVASQGTSQPSQLHKLVLLIIAPQLYISTHFMSFGLCREHKLIKSFVQSSVLIMHVSIRSCAGSWDRMMDRIRSLLLCGLASSILTCLLLKMSLVSPSEGVYQASFSPDHALGKGSVGPQSPHSSGSQTCRKGVSGGGGFDSHSVSCLRPFWFSLCLYHF